MTFIARAALSLAFLLGNHEARAGSYHRCDDGSGTPIYQTAPCAANARTVAQHQYPDTAAALPSRDSATVVRPRARAAAARHGSRAAPLRTREKQPVVAYACELGREKWTQPRPCAAEPGASGSQREARAKLRQRTLTQREVCRQVRDGVYRSARGERPADSTYQRNLMLDHGC